MNPAIKPCKLAFLSAIAVYLGRKDHARKDQMFLFEAPQFTATALIFSNTYHVSTSM